MKDSWDASSSEDEAAKADLKDSWDASSDEEDEGKAPAKAAAAPAAKTAEPKRE